MAAKQRNLDVDSVRREFFYSPKSGIVMRRFARQENQPWTKCGWDTRKGYRQLRVFGEQLPEHVFAWLYMTGEWPEKLIDHINRDKSDNRWDNLRCVDDRTNKLNGGMYANNKSGYRGVCWYPRKQKWLAQITVNNKRRHIGYFESAELASAAYMTAREGAR